MSSQALVEEYLRRLERAAAGLAPARRAELVEDVKEHIEAALSGAGARDESTVRNVLDRLGTPEEIVAAEVGPAASIALPASPAVGPVAVTRSGSWRTPARFVILALSVLLAALIASIVLGEGPGSAAYAVVFAFSSPVVLVLLLVAALTSRNQRAGGPVAARPAGSSRTPARLGFLALCVVLAALIAGIVVVSGPVPGALAVLFAFSSPVVLVLLLVAAVTSRKGR